MLSKNLIFQNHNLTQSKEISGHQLPTSAWKTIPPWHLQSLLLLGNFAVGRGLMAMALEHVSEVNKQWSWCWKLTLCFRYKKGQRLPADGHLQVLHKETKHSVFIPEVCEADAGLYVAQAQNSSGTLCSKAFLHVTGNHKPPITRINWMMLCAIYISVSLMYWLLT